MTLKNPVVAFLRRVFYGDAKFLIAKYFAFWFCVVVSPYLYLLFWALRSTPWLVVLGGVGLTVAIFLITVAVVHRLLTRLGPGREPARA